MSTSAAAPALPGAVPPRHAIPSPDRAGAAQLLEAVCDRDFGRAEALLTSDASLRAVLPPRILEASGPAAIVGWFRTWFGAAERFDVLERSVDDVAGRARLTWRFRVAPHPGTGDPAPHVIEQVLFCDDQDGQIGRVDLLCSGFRPEERPA